MGTTGVGRVRSCRFGAGGWCHLEHRTPCFGLYAQPLALRAAPCRMGWQAHHRRLCDQGPVKHGGAFEAAQFTAGIEPDELALTRWQVQAVRGRHLLKPCWCG